jgi:hypothetical protein
MNGELIALHISGSRTTLLGSNQLKIQTAAAVTRETQELAQPNEATVSETVANHIPPLQVVRRGCIMHNSRSAFNEQTSSHGDIWMPFELDIYASLSLALTVPAISCDAIIRQQRPTPREL